MICIATDLGVVYYYDSLRRQKGDDKPPRDFEPIKESIDAAWDVATKARGCTQFFKGKMYHYFNFPCRQQPEGSDLCAFYVLAAMDDWVRLSNSAWTTRTDFEKHCMDVCNDEHYGFRKDFHRIQNMLCRLINTQVTRDIGEFHGGWGDFATAPMAKKTN